MAKLQKKITIDKSKVGTGASIPYNDLVDFLVLIELEDNDLSHIAKYITIPNINASIPFGNGVYVFSRGPREAPNSYVNQIQTAPFSNPYGYTLTHSGLIYTGDLALGVSNTNANEVGEGFSLGTIPAPLQWGSLIKTNLSPFVWLFDPVNNAYVVSNSPSAIIPSGSGFFVKVLDGIPPAY